MEITKLPLETGLEVLNNDCLMHIFGFLPIFSMNYYLINKRIYEVYCRSIIDHRIEIVIKKNISQKKFDKLCKFYDNKIKVLKIIANSKIYRIELNDLISLRLINCNKITNYVCPPKIQTLQIERCEKLYSLKTNKSLEEFYIKDMPNNPFYKYGEFLNVKTLSCKESDFQWDKINECVKLEKLTIKIQSYMIDSIMIKTLKPLKHLTELNLSNCIGVIKMCKLANLNKLTIKDMIIKDIHKLINLTELVIQCDGMSYNHLKIEHCNKLKKIDIKYGPIIYDRFPQIESLEELILEQQNYMTEISSMNNLKKLSVSKCINLKCIFHCEQLEYLYINECDDIKYIELKKFTNLKKLVLKKCSLKLRNSLIEMIKNNNLKNLTLWIYE